MDRCGFTVNLLDDYNCFTELSESVKLWIYCIILDLLQKLSKNCLKKVTITEDKRPMCRELLYKIYIMIGNGSNVMRNDV